MNLKKAAQKKLKKSGGFTLVEMLIVVAIIAILVVVSIPMVSSSLDKARTATDDANERAAKAAAIAGYLLDENNLGTEVTYCYDAASGQALRHTGVNCATVNGEAIENYGYGTESRGTGHIHVIVDGTDGGATVSWSISS